MNYEILFYCLVSFLFGRASGLRKPLLYIGTDKEKYAKAIIGILTRP